MWDKVRYGIQWWPGSFNEQTLQTYIQQHNITDCQIVYLFTTEHVFQSLEAWDIDYGLFAIHNSAWSLVDESLEAMSRYTFIICEQIETLIQHTLMKRKDISLDQLTTIMAHPQVFLQCKENLTIHYPHLTMKIGEWDFIDTAKVAEALAHGEVPSSYAVCGPEWLAALYDFEIIARNLQDLKDKNITKFLLVMKRE